jgi:hypothetical protein
VGVGAGARLAAEPPGGEDQLTEVAGADGVGGHGHRRGRPGTSRPPPAGGPAPDAPAAPHGRRSRPSARPTAARKRSSGPGSTLDLRRWPPPHLGGSVIASHRCRVEGEQPPGLGEPLELAHSEIDEPQPASGHELADRGTDHHLPRTGAVPQLPLRRAGPGLRVQGVHDHRPGGGRRRRDPGPRHPWLRRLHAPTRRHASSSWTELDGSAEAIGSVNTIVKHRWAVARLQHRLPGRRQAPGRPVRSSRHDAGLPATG